MIFWVKQCVGLQGLRGLFELQFCGIQGIDCELCGGGGRDGENCYLSAEDAEGAGNFNTFLSAENAEGRGELQHLFVRGGRGGARRTSTPFLSAEGAENTLDLFELRGAVVFTLNGFGDQRCSLTRRLRSSLPWLPKLKIRPTWSPAALR